ncbi:hypothetical protein DFP72DRAFT_1067053 [Ephemerocybe angulata]|uniref:Uncharacterized protein n=1 Tax=Ephemerocybe angulata TaxID=980116 RepID=A0A8H6M662_9AGAR|nr:hypothetical protein DFP72DRAFT_1067053 [Tulosesus angulatus]
MTALPSPPPPKRCDWLLVSHARLFFNLDALATPLKRRRLSYLTTRAVRLSKQALVPPIARSRPPGHPAQNCTTPLSNARRRATGHLPQPQSTRFSTAIALQPPWRSTGTRKTHDDEQACSNLAASSERAILNGNRIPAPISRRAAHISTGQSLAASSERAIPNGNRTPGTRCTVLAEPAHSPLEEARRPAKRSNFAPQPHGTRLPTPSDSKHIQGTTVNRAFTQPSHIHVSAT